MKNIVLIIGPSGSGKSYLQKQFIKQGYSSIISSTTRSMREGEKDGVDYFFKKDKEDFFKDEYIESAQVANKYYGTSKKEFHKSDKIVHVIEPYGAKQILNEFSKDSTIKVIFMNISEDLCRNNLIGEKGFLSDKDKTRIKRDIKDSIHDRMKEVQINPDLVIDNLDYDISEILNKL
jgi:guanylate kinase